jgi:tRNA A-37 threonylcarbamoyl transferase component Bud32
MRDLKDGIRSLVRIDYFGHVHKYYRGTDKETRCATEVKILKVLEERKCNNVPKLLDYNLEECWIKTTNCGSPASEITKQKVEYLFKHLEYRFGVIHDDPEPRNITYNEQLGEFCIIDFELATLIEQESK